MGNNRFEFEFSEKQSLFEEAIDDYDNVFYGGAKGGGKSAGLRKIMLKRRMEQPGTIGAIFRESYPDLYDNHIDPLLNEYPQLRNYYVASHKEIRLPNRSVLRFRYVDSDRSLKRHQGREYHDLAIEEAGEWPENWFWTLKGSNRSTVEGVKPRCILTGNPGGIGHKWLKKLFIREDRTEQQNKETWKFIPALASDNPWLMENDPRYLERLKNNPNQMLVEAYAHGNWDIAAGQYFDTFDRNVHVIDPFEIPKHWKVRAGYDHGFNHPAAFIWFASDEDGNVYFYREFAKAQREVREICEELLEYPDTRRIDYVPSGHDCWTKRDKGPTVAEKFYEHSKGEIILKRAVIDRVPGWTHIREYLFHDENTKPRMFVFRTCPMVIETLSTLTHDPKNIEDVLKTDAVDGDPYSGDDVPDAVRYGLMSRPAPSMPVESKRDRYQRRRRRGNAVSWRTV